MKIISFLAAIVLGFRLNFVDPNQGGGGGDDFENPDVGENFGGSYPRLDLNEGQTSAMLEYIKDADIEVRDDSEGAEPNAKKVLEMHVLRDINSGVLCTSPIGAIFDNCWDDAKIQKGDHFKIKRYTDTTKKEGKGKGNKMKVYAIKVYTRARAGK